jgi:hypothetical protein
MATGRMAMGRGVLMVSMDRVDRINRISRIDRTNVDVVATLDVIDAEM